MTRSAPTGIVVRDGERLEARLRGSDRVTFRTEDLQAAFARVISESMAGPLQRARTRLTGRID